jgi:hypothetical protein
MKKKFKIEARGYGGEYAICTKDADFVNKWTGKDQSDLVEEVLDTFYDDADLEHGFGMYCDSYLTVYEVKDGEEEEIEQDVTPNCIISREAYMTDSEHGSVPVLLFHSCEKGSFCSWEVETESFDSKLLTASCVETDFGEFVQDLHYNGWKLELNDENVDTTGKSYYAKVGWINPEWHEKTEKFEDDELIYNLFHDYLKDS